jgi:hypothetical protein
MFSGCEGEFRLGLATAEVTHGIVTGGEGFVEIGQLGAIDQ